MLIDRIEYVDGWPVIGDGSPSTVERPGPACRPGDGHM
jgi:hypothetical protein